MRLALHEAADVKGCLNRSPAGTPRDSAPSHCLAGRELGYWRSDLKRSSDEAAEEASKVPFRR